MFHAKEMWCLYLEEFFEVVIIISVNMYMIQGTLNSNKILRVSAVVAAIITLLHAYKTEYSKTFKTAMIFSLVGASIKKINE